MFTKLANRIDAFRSSIFGKTQFSGDGENIPYKSLSGRNVNEFSRIVVFGDEDFCEKVKNDFRECEVEAISLDVENGESYWMSPKKYCGGGWAFIVGGRKHKNYYRFLLNYLGEKASEEEIFFNYKDFEFCGGNVIVPSDAVDAHIYLYNHFSNFFGINDYLLVRCEVLSSSGSVVNTFALAPNETKIFTKGAYTQTNNPGDLNFTFQVYHPRLTGGRHERWRVYCDIRFKDSLVSLHGTHYFGENKKISGLLTDYTGSGKEFGASYIYPRYDSERCGVGLVRKDVKGSEAIGYSEDDAHPGLFTFTRLHRDGREDAILSNHLISFPKNTTAIDASISKDKSIFIGKLNAKNLWLDPYVIASDQEYGDFELGISFTGMRPTPRHMHADYYIKGKLEKSKSLVLDENRAYYFKEICALGGVEQCDWVTISVDWVEENTDPKKVAGQPDFCVRNRLTQDMDVTEFQSSWRNIGQEIPEYPHWLHISKSLVSGSKLMGRVSIEPDLKDYLVIAGASGNKEFSASSVCKIHLYSSTGFDEEIYSINIDIPYAGIIPLKDICKDIDFVPVGLFIECASLDLNAQIVTLSEGGSVSIQHLWGY